MRYLFVLVFLLVLTSSYLFAYDYSDLYKNCGNNGGFIVLNCRKGEDCLNKDALYDTDIRCGIRKVYKVPLSRIYFYKRLVPENINKNYILEEYVDVKGKKIRACKISYFEYRKGEFKERRTFYCTSDNRLKNFNDICLYASYEIDGQPVEFNESLKGKDPVYDWVMKNMPKNRPNAKYIDFGPDIDSSQFTIY